EFRYLLDVMQAGRAARAPIRQKRFHLVDDDDGRSAINRLVKNFGDLLAGFVDVGTTHAVGINRVAGPIDKLDKPLHSEGLATTWRPVQDNGGRKIDAQSLVFLGIEDDVDDVFVKKLFELWTPRKPEYFSLGRFFLGLRLFRFD